MHLSYFIDHKVSGIKYSADKGSSYGNGRLDSMSCTSTTKWEHRLVTVGLIWSEYAMFLHAGLEQGFLCPKNLFDRVLLKSFLSQNNLPE